MSALLEARNVVKEFRGPRQGFLGMGHATVHAVNDVSFDLKAGEILGLIGPNGAGKSTMFNLITGVLRPDAGRVTLLGEDITGRPARRIAARGVARTFQHVKLRPNMTLIDNVVLGEDPAPIQEER